MIHFIGAGILSTFIQSSTNTLGGFIAVCILFQYLPFFFETLVAFRVIRTGL